MKKIRAVSLAFLMLYTALVLPACSATPTTQQTPHTQSVPAPSTSPRNAPTGTVTYRSAPLIAQRVVQVPGVRSATVLLSGRTAFVAIQQGTAADQTYGRRGVTPGTVSGTTPPVPANPMPGARPYRGTIPGALPGKAPAAGTTALPPAGTTSNTWAVSEQTKQRIADVVRQTEPGIQRVYVSANPAVYSRFAAFARDLASGRPITSLADLSDMIHRIWPEAK